MQAKCFHFQNMKSEIIIFLSSCINFHGIPPSWAEEGGSYVLSWNIEDDNSSYSLAEWGGGHKSLSLVAAMTFE